MEFSTDMKPINNAAILQGIQQGDRRILQSVYRDFFPRIREFVRKNSGKEEEAEDLFQEGIMAVYSRIKGDPGFSLSSSFYTFLYAVCRNLWLKKLQKDKREGVTREEMWVLRDEEEREPDFTEEMEKYIQKSRREQLYRSKFAELGEDCRKILTFFLEGFRLREIAKKMGYSSEMYAKKRKYKCQKKLIESIREAPEFEELKDYGS